MFLDFFKEYPALVSLAAVAAGWFATRRGQIHGDRAKHSHNYLGILDKPEYGHSLHAITTFLDKGLPYREDEYPADDRSRFSQAIWDCLQFMERASIDIDMGYISEEYFYKKYKTLTDRLFIVSHCFINKIRSEKNSETIYKNFEALYIRVHFKSKPLTLRVLEYITVCPNFRFSSSVFAAHLKTIDRNFFIFLREIMRYHQLPSQIGYVENDNLALFQKRIRWLVRFEIAAACISVVCIAYLM